MSKKNKLVVAPEIFGMPPVSKYSHNMMYNSMPLAVFYACEPKFEVGETLFSAQRAMDKYNKMLNDMGYSLYNDQSIQAAYIADTFPTETLTNSYDESFLDEFTGNISKLGQLSQIMGASDLGETYNKITDAMGDVGGFAGKAASTAKSAKDHSDEFFGKMSNSLTGTPLGSMATKIAKSMSGKMAGSRIDFPKVWTGSSFEPTYSLTIRLYNPCPGDEEATKKYIMAPMTALALLATPRSKDGSMYNWPFLCSVECHGLFYLPAAYISSMTIIKGGDAQQISFNQRMGVVDIRLEIASLYSSLVAPEERSVINNSRPNLYDHVDRLSYQKQVYDNDEINEVGNKEVRIENIKDALDTVTKYTPVAKIASSTPLGKKVVSYTNKTVAKAFEPRVATAEKAIEKTLEAIDNTAQDIANVFGD